MKRYKFTIYYFIWPNSNLKSLIKSKNLNAIICRNYFLTNVKYS